jgi:hypothetical protein
MKVVATDNFNRDHISDVLVAENIDVLSARELAEKLNATMGPNGDWFHRVVPDFHKLYKWES